MAVPERPSRAFFIYNPAAGLHPPEHEIGEVVRFLESEGVRVLAVKATLGPGDATTYAREAVAQNCDTVFLSGGDGTIAQAADGLVNTRVTLVVLPGGTGNVLARQLNLPVPGPLHPKPLVEATRLALAGRVLPVDVGRVTLQGKRQRHFLSWAGVGFDAMVNRNVNSDPVRKKQFGIGAFILAAFLTLRDLAGTSVRIKVDGYRANRRIVMLVANNIQLYGVFFRMAQDAVIDDGALDFYAFQGNGPGRTLLHAARLAVNRHISDPEVDIYRGRRMEITSARPLPVHVDGDYVGETPVTIEAVPRSLRLAVPATAPATLFAEGLRLQEPKETAVEWMQRMARSAQNAIRPEHSK
jgi:YegS/Rv2252/BmrU family lipid kinase